MHKTLFINGQLFKPGGGFEPGSLLVEDNVIAEVFRPGDTPTREMASAAKIQRIDVKDRIIVPGFVDAHFHLLALALKGLRCDLSAVQSAADVIDALTEWKNQHPGDQAIVGVEWDESRWGDKTVPTRQMLDELDATRPVFVRRICCHIGVLNTAFLNLLTYAKEFVDRDTGMITENAVIEATKLSYPPDGEIESGIEVAIRALHRLGVTGIHDIIETQNFNAYLAGLQRSPVPLRIDALFHVNPDKFDSIAELVAESDAPMFQPMGIKMYADGSLGARTAALNSAYTDAPTLGMFLLDEDMLAERLRQCHDKGIACAVHAIGDRALRTVLRAMMALPDSADLFRVEHAEMIGRDEMQMLKKSGVSLVVQPNFVRNWQHPGGLYEERLGQSRWRDCNPFAALSEAGVAYAFSSDGMPPGPLYGIKGATEHPINEQRIPLNEALLRYTEAPAKLGRHPRKTGRLEREYWADLAVLSGDFAAQNPDQLRVEQTYVGGELVFDRSAADR